MTLSLAPLRESHIAARLSLWGESQVGLCYSEFWVGAETQRLHLSWGVKASSLHP